MHVTDDAAWDSDGISVLMYHYVYTDDDQPDEVKESLLRQRDRLRGLGPEQGDEVRGRLQ